MCELGSEVESIYKKQGDSKTTRVLKVSADPLSLVDALDGECGAPGLWDLDSQREAAPGVPRARQGAGSRLTATDIYKN